MTIEGEPLTLEGGASKTLAERSKSEPSRWESYLSPAILESDFASIGPYRVLGAAW